MKEKLKGVFRDKTGKKSGKKPGKLEAAPEEEEEKPLWREIIEVLVTLGVILIVLRLLLGAHMPVPLVAVVSCSMVHQDDVLGSPSYKLAEIIGPVCEYNACNEWKEWIRERAPDAPIESFPLRNGFFVGDMIIVNTPDGKGTILPVFTETALGDVVIYRRDRIATGNEPIIHRVVGIVRVKDGDVRETVGTLDCFTVDDFEDRFIPYVEMCQEKDPNCPYKDYPEGTEYNFYITKGDNNKKSDQCSVLQRNNEYAGILPITDSQIVARGWIRVPYLGWLKMILNSILGMIIGIPFMILN